MSKSKHLSSSVSSLPKAPKLTKGEIINCAYVLGANMPMAKKYSKGRHKKALRRAQKANKPISCKLPQTFMVNAED